MPDCPNRVFMNRQMPLISVLALLVAMTVAAGAGMVAWGPIAPRAHVFADGRQFIGIPAAVNVVTSLLPLMTSLVGAIALKRARWARDVARPWRLFFIASAGGSLLAGVYHLCPDDLGFILVHMSVSASSTTLLCGFLAERVHGGFGSRASCTIAISLSVAAAAYAGLCDALVQVADIRALLLLQFMPVLLLPAGGLGLPGRGTTSGGEWLALFSLHLLSRICESADASIFAATGWISGHSLMHIVMAIAVAIVAYRVVAAGPTASLSAASGGASSSRMASANTLTS